MKHPLTWLFAFAFATAALFADIPAAREGKTIVYADVTCDMMHMGHVNFLKQARAFGDYLIIGVLPDEEVMTYKRRPVLNLKERAAMLRSCKYVDEVLEGVPIRRTKEWLIENNIAYVVHGNDFDPKTCSDQYEAPIELGIFRLVSYTPGISTTDIISRIVERTDDNQFDPQVVSDDTP